MNKTLNFLSNFRDFLTKNCKNLNTGKSPVFVLVSLVGGISLAAISTVFASKTMIGRIGIGIGSLAAIVNTIQLIYKKYI